MSIVRKKKKKKALLIPTSCKGACLCVWKSQLPLVLGIGICVLMLIFSVIDVNVVDIPD